MKCGVFPRPHTKKSKVVYTHTRNNKSPPNYRPVSGQLLFFQVNLQSVNLQSAAVYIYCALVRAQRRDVLQHRCSPDSVLSC